MRCLAVPDFNFSTALAESTNGIDDACTQAHYRSQITNLDAAAIETAFCASARAVSLYSLPRIEKAAGNAFVRGTLRKSDLITLYTQYFVPAKKPARYLYDRLKSTPNGKCPLCGDIGHVGTLDHYVPKADFPLYSVMPGNLIPCCRDCNSEKLSVFSTTPEGQTLHPYFDDDKFFSQQWVAARVIPGSPPVIAYYVSPPKCWSSVEKSRVAAHFAEYKLAKRFGVEASADLPETIMTRKNTLQNYSPDKYAEYLREKSENLNLPVNNWRRVMFSCLAADAWFCSNQH